MALRIFRIPRIQVSKRRFAHVLEIDHQLTCIYSALFGRPELTDRRFAHHLVITSQQN